MGQTDSREGDKWLLRSAECEAAMLTRGEAGCGGEEKAGLWGGGVPDGQRGDVRAVHAHRAVRPGDGDGGTNG